MATRSLNSSARQRWNPNRLFGRLRIRTKLAIAFLLLSGAPLALVGWYAADQHLRSLRTSAILEQRRHVEQLQAQVEILLRGVRQDLGFLAKSRLLQTVLESTGGVQEAGPSLASLFHDLLSSKPHYYRFRVLDSTGTELAHVVRTYQGPVVIPAGRWRSTGYRFYRGMLQEGIGDRLKFVPVELRPPPIDERPGEPRLVSAFSFVISLGVRDAADPALLVADVYAAAILQLLDSSGAVTGQRVLLVGPGGHYVHDSASKTDGNPRLATQSGSTLQEEFGAKIAERILAGGGGLLEAPGWVISYAPLFGAGQPQMGDYVVISSVPEEILSAPVVQVQKVVLGAAALTLLVAGILAFLAAHQFTSPIRELQKGAARLAAGEYGKPPQVDTNDELEELAGAFAAMAESIARREGEIEQYAHGLEDMVQERTRELRESQQRLVQQEKMVAVGQLAAGIAHELGTPLGAILVRSEMALDEVLAGGAASGEEIADSLRAVISQAERTRQIVANLLDFSRPSTQDKEMLDLRDLAERAAGLLRHDLSLRGVEIVVELPPSPVRVRGNRNELEQVVFNLARNAADAMPQGGEVRVKLGSERTRWRSGGSTGRRQEFRAFLEVRDTGSGIDPEIRDRIFEPFFTTKAPGVGTGLGLWICYNIVSEHGGTLAVRRSDHRGTIMRAELPCASGPGTDG